MKTGHFALAILLAFGMVMPGVDPPGLFAPEFVMVRWCAAGLALLMIASGVYHVRRKEPADLTVVIFLLALFVIVGRWPN